MFLWQLSLVNATQETAGPFYRDSTKAVEAESGFILSGDGE